MFGPVGVGIIVGLNQVVKSAELVFKSDSEITLTGHRILESDRVPLPTILVNPFNVRDDQVAAIQLRDRQAQGKSADTDGWTGVSGHHVQCHAEPVD